MKNLFIGVLSVLAVVWTIYLTKKGRMEIADNEIGSSVRAKLNRALSLVDDRVLTVTTTDATPTEMVLDVEDSSGGGPLVVPDDTTWAFSLLIVARDSSFGSAAWKAEGAIKKQGTHTDILPHWDGTDPLYSTTGNYDSAKTKPDRVIAATVLADERGAYSVAVDADETNSALRIKVTGGAGRIVHWVAKVRFASVTF